MSNSVSVVCANIPRCIRPPGQIEADFGKSWGARGTRAEPSMFSNAARNDVSSRGHTRVGGRARNGKSRATQGAKDHQQGRKKPKRGTRAETGKKATQKASNRARETTRRRSCPRQWGALPNKPLCETHGDGWMDAAWALTFTLRAPSLPEHLLHDGRAYKWTVLETWIVWRCGSEPGVGTMCGEASGAKSANGNTRPKYLNKLIACACA
jgi:hypothetical protein